MIRATIAGLCLAKVDVKIVTDENVMEFSQKESVNKNMCKGTCTIGSSAKTNRICVDVGEEKPLVFGKFELKLKLARGVSSN